MKHRYSVSETVFSYIKLMKSNQPTKSREKFRDIVVILTDSSIMIFLTCTICGMAHGCWLKKVQVKVAIAVLDGDMERKETAVSSFKYIDAGLGLGDWVFGTRMFSI